MRMTTSYLLLGFLAVAATPWSGGCLQALLNVPYGFLTLILLASLSFAVSLNADFTEEFADGWASDWGISVSNDPVPAAPAMWPVDTVLKEAKVRPGIRYNSENRAVPTHVFAEPLGPFSPLYIDP